MMFFSLSIPGLAGSSSGVSSSATAGSISGSSGSLSEKNNMLGNFARWNEPPSPSQTTRTSIGFPSKKGHQGQDAAVSGESDTTDPTRLLHIQVSFSSLTVANNWGRQSKAMPAKKALGDKKGRVIVLLRDPFGNEPLCHFTLSLTLVAPFHLDVV